MNEETTLESVFDSPIIPIVNKNFYPVLLEVSKNLDVFNWTEFMEIVYELGFQPERLR